MELMEDGTTIEQQMFAMATEKKVPLYGVLELLPLCNLNCDMCYVRMSREEMEEVGRLRTMEEWTKTAEDMMRAGTLFVLLTGGEPLLYPHFRELYQKLRELGMIITINTNGTLINEAWADFFAENKPRRINITLYGASNETYERLCHYPGGFDKAVNGIRLLRERNIDVKVNGSLAKANVDDRMKIIELGESLDAPVRIDTYMYPSVRERNHAYNNQARLDPEMAAKAVLAAKGCYIPVFTGNLERFQISCQHVEGAERLQIRPLEGRPSEGGEDIVYFCDIPAGPDIHSGQRQTHVRFHGQDDRVGARWNCGWILHGAHYKSGLPCRRSALQLGI